MKRRDSMPAEARHAPGWKPRKCGWIRRRKRPQLQLLPRDVGKKIGEKSWLWLSAFARCAGFGETDFA